MIRLSAKARIAMGMTMLVITMLMLINMMGLIRDPRKIAMDGRCAISELVALQVRPEILDQDLLRIEALIDAVVQRNDEILSGAVRRGDGKVVAMIGDHNQLWDTEVQVSDDRQVYVPLHAGGNHWGRVEICFTPLVRRGMIGLLDNPSIRLIGLTGLMCWIAFYFYLRKMLNHLDPSRAVPGRVRSALDTLGDGLLVLDRDERIVLANQSLAKSIGTTPDELMGIEAASLPWVLAKDKNDCDFPWTRAIQEGDTVQGATLRCHREDADDAVFMISCSPVPGSDGSPQGVLVSLDDVTELEETKVQLSQSKDAAEAANHAKSDFLANMSHEIRTPMNAILGFTEVLRRDIESDENKRRKHLNTIHSSGTHLLNLINDILDLSKVEADRMELESIPCAVHRVVADVVTVMGVRAEEKGIWLDFQFDGKIPESISSDPARLRQILTNLVGNAIKFTEKGGVRIITRLETKNDRPQMVIQVVDTGIGMSEEAADKIFDPFSQADASVTRRFGGTGLGLSISKRFAEGLGGGIRVLSEEGVGSVFVLTIDTGPLETVAWIEPSEKDLEVASGDDESLAISLPNMRVLLVDDGEENRDLMSVVLDEAGATYATAENGLQAIELATSQSWDVILMDMQMPVMDGYTATRKLREQGYDLPIIALTAHAMQQAEQRCRDAGCSGFLTKPIEFDKLITTLAEVAGLEVHKVSEIVKPIAAEEALATSAQGSEPPTLPIRCSLTIEGSTLQEIVNDFVKQLPLKINDMTAALDKRDFAQLADLTHWLKESGPNVGFDDFADPSEQLQRCATDENAEGAEKLISLLRSMAARIEIEDTPPGTTSEFTCPGEPIFSTLPLHKAKFLEIATRFVDRLDTRFAVLQAACDESDSEQLADLAHALKGASANCGFQQIATLAGTLEMASRDGDLELVPSILKELQELRARIQMPEMATI